MDMQSYAKAVDTVGWFMGNWPLAQKMLEEKMHKEGIVGFGFFMHDGSYYQIYFRETHCIPNTKERG